MGLRKCSLMCRWKLLNDPKGLYKKARRGELPNLASILLRGAGKPTFAWTLELSVDACVTFDGAAMSSFCKAAGYLSPAELAKAFSWRIVATLTTALIAYVITGEMDTAIMIGGIEFFLKLAFITPTSVFGFGLPEPWA